MNLERLEVALHPVTLEAQRTTGGFSEAFWVVLRLHHDFRVRVVEVVKGHVPSGRLDLPPSRRSMVGMLGDLGLPLALVAADPGDPTWVRVVALSTRSMPSMNVGNDSHYVH